MPLAIHSQTKLALGSDTTLVLVTDTTPEIVDQFFRTLWLTIFRFEQRFSRFLIRSELGRLNTNAGTPIHVSTDFVKLLRAAMNLYHETDGLYNPFILPAVQRTGYITSRVPGYALDTSLNYSNRRIATPDEVIIKETSVTIPVNSALDFGGIGKGYLADLLARVPFVCSLPGYWFSLGGDVVGGGLNEKSEHWPVQISNAQSASQQYALKTKSPFYIATSGTSINGNHIIDPRSNTPARGTIAQATVAAESTTKADVYASCAIILGSKDAVPWLRSKNIPSALLQNDDGSIDGYGYLYNAAAGKL